MRLLSVRDGGDGTGLCSEVHRSIVRDRRHVVKREVSTPYRKKDQEGQMLGESLERLWTVHPSGY